MPGSAKRNAGGRCDVKEGGGLARPPSHTSPPQQKIKRHRWLELCVLYAVSGFDRQVWDSVQGSPRGGPEISGRALDARGEEGTGAGGSARTDDQSLETKMPQWSDTNPGRDSSLQDPIPGGDPKEKTRGTPRIAGICV